MQPALLAAFVLGNLPVFLYPQPALPNAAWPTHATIAVPQGWIADGQEPQLLEAGKPMLAHYDTVARWPDGSPKWLHAHGVFHYKDGKPAQYEFVRAKAPVPAPTSPLVVRDEKDGIRIDTGTIQLVIPRPFVGIASLKKGDKSIVEGDGGPYVVDGEGTLWHSKYDPNAEVVVETQGPAMVIVKASGWYQTPEPRDDAFCRFSTRITAYANSSIVKFDHATTFADDMKKHKIAELAFQFVPANATSFESSTHRGTFHGKLHAAYFAQLSDDRLYRIAQNGPDDQRDIRHKGDYERSAGWFSTNVDGEHLALLTKDFWQKCPKEVKLAPRDLTFYTWPKHGDLARPDPTATLLHNVYKFKCFHSGKLLDSNLPDEYFEVLQKQTDTTECKPEFARAGNMQGVSMRNQFALAIVPAASSPDATREYLDKLQQIQLQNPTARVSPQTLAASGVFGPTIGATSKFAAMERVVVNGLLGTARSIPRYGDYGWAIYGNLHHFELMDYKVDGKRVGRPSLHRVWNNNHYQQTTTLWQVWGLNGDARLLQMARMCTDNYASIGQVRYDKQWAQGDPADPKRRPSVKFHTPGAFYHCKAILPWGSRDYGMETVDVDAALWAHFPDPTALLYAWLLDADRWCKDGYDLWRENVKFPLGGTRREINQTFVQAMNLYEYSPDEKTLAAIKGMLFGSGGGQGLLSLPIEQQQPGPIWNALWLSRAYEMFPEDKQLQEFIVRSADTLDKNFAAIWTLALSATAWQITGDIKYLERHGGTLDRLKRRLFQDPTGHWQDYGLSPGPIGDDFFALQWHRFARALHDAGLGIPKPPPEPGQYLCSITRFDNAKDVAARGTRVLILNEGPARVARKITIDATRLIAGDIPATSMALYEPSGQPVWNESRIAMSNGGGKRRQRPSSWLVFEETYQGPRVPGLHTLTYGSYAICVFQGLADGLPECQAIRNERVSNWPERITYCCSNSRGWLVPLADRPAILRFIAYGTQDGSHISLTPKSGNKTDRWLVAGESMEIPLAQGEGPWYLDIDGDGSSATKVEVTSDIELPLLYGFHLDQVQAIKAAILAPVSQPTENAQDVSRSSSD